MIVVILARTRIVTVPTHANEAGSYRRSHDTHAMHATGAALYRFFFFHFNF